MTDLDYDDLDLDEIAEQEARIDAGDLLDAALVCSFLERDADSPACPHEATGIREISEVRMPACPHHTNAGGCLNRDAMNRYAVAMVRRLNDDAAASARRLGIDDLDHAPKPRYCSSCAKPMFPGGDIKECADCYEEPPAGYRTSIVHLDGDARNNEIDNLALRGEFPFKFDRHNWSGR